MTTFDSYKNRFINTLRTFLQAPKGSLDEFSLMKRLEQMDDNYPEWTEEIENNLYKYTNGEISNRVKMR